MNKAAAHAEGALPPHPHLMTFPRGRKVIESRIKRALWAVSILIPLGFGGHSAYQFRQEAQLKAYLANWIAERSALSDECAGWSERDRMLGLCESRLRHTGEDISEFSHYRFNAADEAQQSLAIAVCTPVVLWALFFLLRWICEGRVRNSQPLAAQANKSTSAPPATHAIQATAVVLPATMEPPSVMPVPKLATSQAPDHVLYLHPDVISTLERDKIIAMPLAGPWRRFWARNIDIWLLALPVMFGLGFALPLIDPAWGSWLQKPGSEYTIAWFGFPLVLLAEAIVFGVFGNTPGKTLMGLRVTTVGTTRPSFDDYLSRLVGVYWFGLGTGIPIVNLFTMIKQYQRLKLGREAGYDSGRFNVRGNKLGLFRISLAVVVVFLLLVVVPGILKELARNGVTSYSPVRLLTACLPSPTPGAVPRPESRPASREPALAAHAGGDGQYLSCNPVGAPMRLAVDLAGYEVARRGLIHDALTAGDGLVFSC